MKKIGFLFLALFFRHPSTLDSIVRRVCLLTRRFAAPVHNFISFSRSRGFFRNAPLHKFISPRLFIAPTPSRDYAEFRCVSASCSGIGVGLSPPPSTPVQLLPSLPMPMPLLPLLPPPPPLPPPLLLLRSEINRLWHGAARKKPSIAQKSRHRSLVTGI